MSLSQQLLQFLESGGHRIGEIEIQSNDSFDRFILFHRDDAMHSSKRAYGGLEVHHDPFAARDISTYASDGSYRFTKGQTNLVGGWMMILKSVDELRTALDLFYPAAVGLWIARGAGSLEIEHLRPKLDRQTGMYQNARLISDAGAQELVRKVCGPAHRCAKRILWQIDADTPLEDSEAARYNGIPGDVPEEEAIPLLCREACNHFVAECRKASSAERKGKCDA